MEGVEILAIGERATALNLDGRILFFVVGLFAICGFIIAGFESEKIFGFRIFISGLAMLIGMFVGLVVEFIVGIAGIEYYPTYKVTITEEVKMTDFMNRYEILEQEGSIYTVKEREGN